MNIFAQASKDKLRFETPRGLQLPEALWDIPLQSSNGFNLETLADDIDNLIGATPKRSRITKRKNVNRELQLKLDIIEYIIETKLNDIDNATAAASTKDRRVKLTQALADQEADDLKRMSAAALRKELKNL